MRKYMITKIKKLIESIRKILKKYKLEEGEDYYSKLCMGVGIFTLESDDMDNNELKHFHSRFQALYDEVKLAQKYQAEKHLEENYDDDTLFELLQLADEYQGVHNSPRRSLRYRSH